MLRIISANLNGVRSARAKGFFDWLALQKADIVCTQELKAREVDMDDAIQSPDGFKGWFHCAQRPGYSGVGLYTRKPASEVVCGFGVTEFDDEGRYIEARYDKSKLKLAVVSLYLPSGSAGELRQASKFRFLESFLPHLQALRDSGREIVLCGDWNIAHQEIDLKNWRANRKHSGFLPEERAWLTQVFDELGFVDVHRKLDARPEQYTWWSNRGQARAKNVGWRIDYQIATPGIAAQARAVSVYTDAWFSDHAPLTIDYAVKL
ncbi:exodeoxyribonuclease III [soil metagenome]